MLRSRNATYIGYEKVWSPSPFCEPTRPPSMRNCASSRGFCTGSSRSRTWSVSVKIDVFAATPSASDRMAVAANPGLSRRTRTPYRKSWPTLSKKRLKAMLRLPPADRQRPHPSLGRWRSGFRWRCGTFARAKCRVSGRACRARGSTVQAPGDPEDGHERRHADRRAPPAALLRPAGVNPRHHVHVSALALEAIGGGDLDVLQRARGHALRFEIQPHIEVCVEQCGRLRSGG